jgi:hypothetical protein
MMMSPGSIFGLLVETPLHAPQIRGLSTMLVDLEDQHFKYCRQGNGVATAVGKVACSSVSSSKLSR